MFTVWKQEKLFAHVNTETVDIGHKRALPDAVQVCMMSSLYAKMYSKVYH